MSKLQIPTHIFSRIISTIIVASMVVTFFSGIITAQAAGATLTVSPSTSAVSTAGNITLSYTTPAALAIGNTIQIIRANGYTGTPSTTNTTVNTATPTTVANAASASTTTTTITLSAGITSGATVTIVLGGLTSPSTAGNYSFTYIDTNNTYGGNFQYVGSANVVNVTGFVPSTLSFVVRDSTDTTNTNLCDLGTLSTTAVSTCAYRLKVTTNAKNGYTISYLASGTGNFTDGINSFSNAVAGTGGTGGTDVSNTTAGTEKYGVVVTKGSVTGSGGITSLPSAFDAGGTNALLYNNTTSTLIFTATKGNSPATTDTTNTTLVTHKANISGNTAAGAYTVTYTYTVTPSF